MRSRSTCGSNTTAHFFLFSLKRGAASLEERKDLLRVVYQQQERLAVPDVDAEMYNLPDCPIPVVKSLHILGGEWPEEMRRAHEPEGYKRDCKDDSETSNIKE